MARIFIVLTTLCLINNSFASSCCGQSSTNFTILNLQQKLNVNTSFSTSNSVGRVFENSDKFYVFKDKQRKTQLIKLDIAGSLTDRSQIFINTGYQKGSYQDQYSSDSSYNFSDTLIGFSYESLPEYNFSYWKPVIYLTALVNLPTGNSIYDKNSLGEGAGVSGHNQYGAGLGITFIKVYYPLKFSLQTKLIELFKDNINGEQISGFTESSISFNTSYSLNAYILKSGITYSYLSSRLFNLNPTSSSKSTTLSFGIQSLISDKVSIGLNYADQTLLGSPKNTVLNRSISASMNYNYY